MSGRTATLALSVLLLSGSALSKMGPSTIQTVWFGIDFCFRDSRTVSTRFLRGAVVSRQFAQLRVHG